MKIVVDTNVAIAALLRDSIVRKLLFNPVLELYAPDHMFRELEEHRDEIIKKAGISSQDFKIFINRLQKFITILEPSLYSQYIVKANEVLEDPDDLPFAASAIALSDLEPCWLWSYDPHFLDKQEKFSNVLGIKIVTTKLIYRLLNK